MYRTIAILLCSLMAGADAPALLAQAGPTPPKLLITILDGEDALNNIKQRTAREPIVQVEDENHKPIAGAAVLFLLPDSGPGGVFLDGTKLLSMTTDATGRAVARGLTPNHAAGSYQIRVKVNYNGSTAETSIHQTNVSGKSNLSQHASHGLPLKAILVVASIAAATGVIVGIVETRGGSSSTTITAGTPTVGAP